MPDILAARAQMGMSLAFHIVFACVALRRRKRLIAKSLTDHRACAFEIKIKDFEAKRLLSRRSDW